MVELTWLAMPMAELTVTPQKALSSTLTPLVAPIDVTELSRVHPEKDKSDLNVAPSHILRIRILGIFR